MPGDHAVKLLSLRTICQLPIRKAFWHIQQYQFLVSLQSRHQLSHSSSLNRTESKRKTKGSSTNTHKVQWNTWHDLQIICWLLNLIWWHSICVYPNTNTGLTHTHTSWQFIPTSIIVNIQQASILFQSETNVNTHLILLLCKKFLFVCLFVYQKCEFKWTETLSQTHQTARTIQPPPPPPHTFYFEPKIRMNQKVKRLVWRLYDPITVI